MPFHKIPASSEISVRSELHDFVLTFSRGRKCDIFARTGEVTLRYAVVIQNQNIHIALGVFCNKIVERRKNFES